MLAKNLSTKNNYKKTKLKGNLWATFFLNTVFLERAKGFEPSTSTLARLPSTNILNLFLSFK